MARNLLSTSIIAKIKWWWNSDAEYVNFFDESFNRVIRNEQCYIHGIYFDGVTLVTFD